MISTRNADTLQVWKIGKSDRKEDLVVGINLYRNKISEEKEVDNDVRKTRININIKQAGRLLLYRQVRRVD